MTKQETFDFVVKAIVEQGRPAVDQFGNCEYRTADGRKCAAGHLIPDDQYQPSLEGWSVGTESVPESKRLRDIITAAGHDADLVSALQSAHDQSASEERHGAGDFMPMFLERAKSVAVRHGLTVGEQPSV